ncbi:MAG TPA: aldose epimerase [Kiritimatiellia bacterium]
MGKTNRNGVDVWAIASPGGRVRAEVVPAWGGIGSSLVFDGRELLFQHEFFWNPESQRTRGGWPFLFPICGRLERGGVDGAYLHDGRVYNLPIHGFGSRMPWGVADSAEDRLTLVLTDTEATRAAYPFRFEVRLAYRVESDAFVCEQSYANRGDRPMPYYAGFHPYFRTPPPGAGKQDVKVDLKPVRRLKYNQRLTDIVGEEPVPTMPLSVTDPHASEMLLRVGEDREARLVHPDGLVIRMRAESFDYIQLYTMPELPFFCIEPWMSHPNSLNTAGAVRWLAPGQTERSVLRVWVT